MEKWLCMAAMIAAGIILLVYGIDLATGFPFDRSGMTTDIMFVVASALVLWQGYDTWREVT